MKLQPKAQLCEYLLGLSMLLQTFFPNLITPLWSLLGYFFITYTKSRLEGFRVNYIFFTILQLLLFSSSNLLFRLIILTGVYLSIVSFPLYENPIPSGEYLIGYRRFDLNGEGKVTGAIYYPTTQTTQDVNYGHNTGAWERFAEIIIFYARVRKGKHAPRFFYKFIFSVFEFQHLGVNLNSKPADNIAKFPVVVFSHGLAGHIHAYSTQIKEWVSHGYIVFSVDHDEKISVPMKSLDEYNLYVKQRAAQLGDRRDAVVEVLNWVHDPEKLRDLFAGATIPVDYEKIILAGHSFGGATACEVAYYDKRVTGGLLLLDPWLAPCDEKVLSADLKKPILMIRSETFSKSDRFKNEPVGFLKANDQGRGLLVSGYFKGSTHHCSSDVMLHLPREMVLFRMLQGMKSLPNQINSQVGLTRVFLKGLLERKEQEKNLRNYVLEKFRECLSQASKEDLLEADESLMAQIERNIVEGM